MASLDYVLVFFQPTFAGCLGLICFVGLHA